MTRPVDLLEQGATVSKVDQGAITRDSALASIAISMKRIADVQERQTRALETLADWAAENWKVGS